jgi:hypothetical protein
LDSSVIEDWLCFFLLITFEPFSLSLEKEEMEIISFFLFCFLCFMERIKLVMIRWPFNYPVNNSFYDFGSLSLFLPLSLTTALNNSLNLSKIVRMKENNTTNNNDGERLMKIIDGLKGRHSMIPFFLFEINYSQFYCES